MLPATVKRLSFLAVLALIFAATPSLALLVQPVFIDMRYSGVQSNAGLRVVNDRNRPMSVEVSVNSVTVPETGDAVFTPVEGEDFLIFPSVANIPANGAQIFRVRWIGDPALAEGQIFALTTSELPVESAEDTGAAVQLLYAVQTIIGIGPANARADIKVAAISRFKQADGASGVLITFENSAAIHGQINSATLTISTPGWSYRMEPADVSNVVGLGLVPANARRTMFIPIAGVPAEGELTVVADIPRSTVG